MSKKLKNIKSTNALDELIGNKINQLRLAKGLTRDELAQVVGVTHQQLQKYEKGVNRITASRLVDIANALGTDATFFFSDDALPLDAEHIERQRICIEMMRDFSRIRRPEQQEAIRRLVKVLVDADATE